MALRVSQGGLGLSMGSPVGERAASSGGSENEPAAAVAVAVAAPKADAPAQKSVDDVLF